MINIDIIINTYNSDIYLPSALESIKKQTISNQVLVHIIEDGGSGTYEDILKKYEPYFPIKYHKIKKNLGIGGASEFSFKNTHLPFITVLNSDDEFFDETSLEILYNLIKDDENIIVSMGKEKRNDIINNHYGQLVAKIYRRSFIEENNLKFSKQRSGSDVVFNISLYSLLKDNQIKETDKIVYNWLDNNDESLTHIYNDCTKEMEENVKNIRKFMKKHPESKLSTTKIKWLIEGLYNMESDALKKSPDFQIKFYKACHSYYKLYKNEIDRILNLSQEDYYYQKISKFINTVKKY